MIPDIFINFGYSVISWIIGVFPSSEGFGANVFTAASTLGGYTGIFAPLINFTVLASCVAIAFSVEIAIFGFKTFKWVLSHVPFIGGNG